MLFFILFCRFLDPQALGFCRFLDPQALGYVILEFDVVYVNWFFMFCFLFVCFCSVCVVSWWYFFFCKLIYMFFGFWLVDLGCMFETITKLLDLGWNAVSDQLILKIGVDIICLKPVRLLWTSLVKFEIKNILLSKISWKMIIIRYCLCINFPILSWIGLELCFHCYGIVVTPRFPNIKISLKR